MSKKQSQPDVSPSGMGYPSGYIIQDYDVRHLQGRLLTLVEALGLRESQEKSLKDLITQNVWKLLEPCFIINGKDWSELALKYQKDKKDEGYKMGMVGNSNYPIPSEQR